MSRFLLVRTILFSFCILSPSWVLALGYTHQVEKIKGQTVHLVTINPQEYRARLVKAQGARETVPSIAKRSNADIAINGGFFEMNNERDGFPSGSLVINGKVYKVKNTVQALAIIHKNVLSIESTNSKKYFQDHPGPEYSFVSGIPLLINKGKIVDDILTKESSFYKKPHARTAIGLKANGEIVLCVVEHTYAKDLAQMTLGEVQSLVQAKGSLVAQEYEKKGGEMTLNDLKKIFKEELSQRSAQGFTMPELAKFMKKSGCEFALNLDGGGSSTLWIKGKVINSVVGDEDESEGLAMLRPVSDALIFNKK